MAYLINTAWISKDGSLRFIHEHKQGFVHRRKKSCCQTSADGNSTHVAVLVVTGKTKKFENIDAGAKATTGFTC